MTTVIWWARRDLRLHDNDALKAALAHGDRVVPVFVLDPALLTAADVSEVRVAFLFDGLRSLDADLRTRGSRLIVRRGQPQAELARLVAETGAEAIYAEADPWPYGRRRDAKVAAELPLRLMHGLTVHPSDMILKTDRTPYTVFTPFSRAWKALPLPTPSQLWTPPERFPPVPEGLDSVAIPGEPALPASVPFPAGEAEALRRLRAFTSAQARKVPQNPAGLAPVYRYSDDRNRMDLDGTSQLSPYLRFGMVSARRAAVAALQAIDQAPDPGARKGAETWLNELIWREFYMAILYHFPFVLEQAFQEHLRDIPWRNDEAEFAAWCEGRTGYPVVDAAMRQLVTTGWMHNRARMIVASFLTKDLLVDWRWGERYFMQHLVDGDPAANNGGWQWTAGVGTDAAPYFRIFNPSLQGARFDPEGVYVRRWVPELANVPLKYLHEPWTMPLSEQSKVGCRIGRDYPLPIVDHALARERTLRAYRRPLGAET
ncbi:MAG: cryptochrome/photolyase family protein [Anaerolineae bacterium]